MLWQFERLVILLWSLGHVDELPAPDEQCDPSRFGHTMPPVSDESDQDFISHATTRPEGELWQTCDEILRQHWEAREERRSGRKPSRPVEIEIAQERHHAINWITGYDAAPWDEVTRDTWCPKQYRDGDCT
jgi:hypothetical protein